MLRICFTDSFTGEDEIREDLTLGLKSDDVRQLLATYVCDTEMGSAPVIEVVSFVVHDSLAGFVARVQDGAEPSLLVGLAYSAFGPL